ncbi:MAG: hypothetical protein GEV11_09325 [Streptosporangiales bacterium]|nr:hypothetical protein [Streptosporangiales bacterium]
MYEGAHVTVFEGGVGRRQTWCMTSPSAPVFPANPAERALQSAIADHSATDALLAALAEARLWIPLPDGAEDDGISLPTLEYDATTFVPAYTSMGQLEHSAPNLSCAVVRGFELVRLLPDEFGLALNPGGEGSVPVYPEGVAVIRTVDVDEEALAAEDAELAERAQEAEGAHAAGGLVSGPDGTETDGAGAVGMDEEPPAEPRVTVAVPDPEPAALRAALSTELARVPQAHSAADAWVTVDGEAGLIVGVGLDHPDDPAEQEAALYAVEGAVIDVRPEHPVDVVFLPPQPTALTLTAAGATAEGGCACGAGACVCGEGPEADVASGGCGEGCCGGGCGGAMTVDEWIRDEREPFYRRV